MIPALIHTIRIAMIFSLIALSSSFLHADIGNFDVAEIEINGRTVYFSYESPGKLQNGDFCYYTYDGEYLFEVEDFIENHLQKGYGKFYEELHRVDMTHIARHLSYQQVDDPFILFVLRKKTERDAITYNGTFRLIRVWEGNTYGYRYADALTEKDNSWLSRHSFERIGETDQWDICQGTLYAIKGKMSDTEKTEVLREVNELIQKANESPGHYDLLERKFNELHKKKIVLLGFCSC